jgi:hypothetical protein
MFVGIRVCDNADRVTDVDVVIDAVTILELPGFLDDVSVI